LVELRLVTNTSNTAAPLPSPIAYIKIPMGFEGVGSLLDSQM
jgi:hypothetical protein